MKVFKLFCSMVLLVSLVCIVPNDVKALDNQYDYLEDEIQKGNNKGKRYTTVNNIVQGKCGDTINWSYDPSDKVLSISGQGEMYNYHSQNNIPPWASYDIDSIELDEGITYIGSCAFSGLSFTKVSLPSSLEVIGAYAFQDSSIETVTIPKGVKTLGYASFSYCSQLSKVTLSTSITDLGEYTFENCTSLKEIAIPNQLKYIRKGCFSNCSSLQKVTFPLSLIEIKDEAFKGNKALKSINLPNKLRIIGSESFSECTLSEISFSSSLIEIKDKAFKGNISLKNITLPSKLKTIGSESFSGCSLSKILFSSSLTVIKDGAFKGNKSLKSINLPSKLKTINKYAFLECGLTTVVIPKSVTFIEYEAFDENVKLKPEDMLYRLRNGSYVEGMNVPVYVQDDYKKAFEVLKLVNKERKAKKLKPLNMDKDLLKAAMIRAHEVSLKFDHVRPSGEYCGAVSSKLMGENIAAGQTTSDFVMYVWMHSSGHRSNILANDYKSIGIGVTKVNGVYYWVQCFGITSASKAKESSYKNTKTYKTNVAITKLSDAAKPKAKLGKTSLGLKSKTTASMYFFNGYKSITMKSSLVKYSSSDSKIASINSKGSVTAKKTGKVTITMSLKASPKVKVTKTLYVVPAKVTLSSVKSGKKYATVKYKKATGASGYQIAYRKKGASKWSYITTTSLSKKITKLKSKKTYQFKVRAYKIINKKKYYGSYSNTKTCKIR